MKDQQQLLFELLQKNPQIHVASIQPAHTRDELHLSIDPNASITPLTFPKQIRDHQLKLFKTHPLHTLITPVTTTDFLHTHQRCQDEPIELGTQIQPFGASWVGTAGCPVQWLDRHDRPHWGILSNWHVMAHRYEQRYYPQHQPDSRAPAIANLAAWSPPLTDAPNLIDAAIADSAIDGSHTISDKLLGIGQIGPAPINATVGLQVSKSGRTTGVTHATCTATGAAVRVAYPDFEAIFVDQDIYQSPGPSFSDPGDSGSIILESNSKSPASLLFAGNGALTIGNPIRHVTQTMRLVYPFNQTHASQNPNDPAHNQDRPVLH